MKFELVTLLSILVAVTTAATNSEWAVYKAVHKKAYSPQEDRLRRLIYEDNLKKIKEHNELYARGLKSYILGENQFADMTSAEFVKTMNGFRPRKTPTPVSDVYAKLNLTLPAEVNWVKKGYVTPVQNQGQCGSCWSFSTTGSIEGAHFKKTGKLVKLSEKNLMDCSWSYGDQGCNGGLMDDAFKYVIDNGGIDTEASYPYNPVSSHDCEYTKAKLGATISSFQDIPSGSEVALQSAVATIGPVSVAIDASQFSFQMYKAGVYDEPNCSSTALDHGVLAAGYGTEDGKDYWLVKNSWGPSWGVQGYIKMSRNKNNQCGIATSASYPVA